MIRPNLSVSVYAVLIRVLPVSFRRENENEMIEHFRWLSSQSLGSAGSFRLWRMILADTIWAAFALRRDSVKNTQFWSVFGRWPRSLSAVGAGALFVLLGIILLPERSPDPQVLLLTPAGLELVGEAGFETEGWEDAYAGATIKLQVPYGATAGELSSAVELLIGVGVKRIQVESMDRESSL